MDVSKQRYEEDEVLASTAIRDTVARATKATAGNITMATTGFMLLCWALVRGRASWGAALFVLGVPAISFLYWLYGTWMVRRAEKFWRMLPIWERHRITLVLESVVDKREGK